jgi:hypothetical protein
MSRYEIEEASPYSEVIVGYDEGMGALFLQAFDDQDEPAVWHPRIDTLPLLELILSALELELPSELRAQLDAEMRAESEREEREDELAFQRLERQLEVQTQAGTPTSNDVFYEEAVIEQAVRDYERLMNRDSTGATRDLTVVNSDD